MQTWFFHGRCQFFIGYGVGKNMKENVKSIIFGIFALIFGGVWIFALQDWELMLFHVIPINNIVAGIIFAVIGVICLLGGLINKK